MKALLKIYLSVLIVSCFACHQGMASEVKIDTSNSKTYYAAVEIHNVLCGFSETTVSPMKRDGEAMLMIEGEVHVLLSLMGEGMDMEFDYEYQCSIDHTSYVYSTMDVSVGTTKINYTTCIEEGIARYESNLSAKTKTIELGDDVILETPLFYPHLHRDFFNPDLIEKTYLVYDDSRGEIIDKKYRLTGNEEIVVIGEEKLAKVFEEINMNSGERTKIWIDANDGFFLRGEFPGGRIVYLSDPSVKKKISTGNLTESLFAGVDLIIPNVPEISYMKVAATIQSTGEWLTPESLNYPGQTFTGTVTENLIEGIFEMEYIHYDGSDAPDFPFDYSNDTTLGEYLEAEYLIEADHPKIIAEAREITNDAADSWEASKRLSKWVSENIHGAIPGGTSAIGTYESRSGECGGHSRLLTAFCRSVGIPARLATGCMYTKLYGGSFGQHVWNEIYMGDAGWIPVDASAFEIDFIDCGHIKLGEITTFNPEKMEILEYRVGTDIIESLREEIPSEYQKFIGSYTNPNNGNILDVSFNGSGISVTLPNQMELKLQDAGEDDKWYAEITNQLYFSFSEDNTGKVTNMLLTQIIPVPRKPVELAVNEGVPDEFKPYLGTFYSMQMKSEFHVVYKDNSLAIDDPNAGAVIGLELPDKDGIWKDEFGKHAIGFDKSDDGTVTAMRIYQNVNLVRTSDKEISEVVSE